MEAEEEEEEHEEDEGCRREGWLKGGLSVGTEDDLPTCLEGDEVAGPGGAKLLLLLGPPLSCELIMAKWMPSLPLKCQNNYYEIKYKNILDIFIMK